MENITRNPNEDLHVIRDMMERSSKFLSLSGMSGIIAGTCALIGAAVAWFFILDSGHVTYDESLRTLGESSTQGIRSFLILDAILVLVAAALGAFYFSYRKAVKAGQPIWTGASRRMIYHLAVPLLAGGIFSLILVFRNDTGMVASAMLIFYGLALVNAGKFTFGEIHYLGLTEILLGVLAGIFIHFGLLLWTIGFGLMHVVYGTVMYYRHGA